MSIMRLPVLRVRRVTPSSISTGRADERSVNILPLALQGDFDEGFGQAHEGAAIALVPQGAQELTQQGVVHQTGPALKSLVADLHRHCGLRKDITAPVLGVAI